MDRFTDQLPVGLGKLLRTQRRCGFQMGIRILLPKPGQGAFTRALSREGTIAYEGVHCNS